MVIKDTNQPKIDDEVLIALRQVLGQKYVITNDEEKYLYGKDQTLDFYFPFDILVKPSCTQEVSEVVQICNKFLIPITPRGGGSGVTGGALPVKRGVVISLERLNKIIELNTTDNFVITESGVITAELCAYLEKENLILPVTPSSSALSFVGGNVAENAGSINSCKYGTISQYVLNLEVVLPTGEVVWTGANVAKNATGLNVTQLFVGSEGILGIITKIVFRLLTKPAHELNLLCGFSDLKVACDAVIAIKKSKILPSAVELICSNAIKVTTDFFNEDLPLVESNISAHLLIYLTADATALMTILLDDISVILEQYINTVILVGHSTPEKNELSKLRFNIGNAITSQGKTYRDIDACVPLSHLYNYLLKVEDICKKHGVKMIPFGHALDGNIHTMLQFENNLQQKDVLIKEVITAVYETAIGCGGTITGEHGIGMLQRDFLSIQYSSAQLKLLKNIKDSFDPNGIMNPGKIF